jgi:hypothetical protein
MKRFLTIVAATAAAAAVAAAITLPADANRARDQQSTENAAFLSCLRTHGIPLPAGLDDLAAKQWLGDHADTAGLEAAFTACEPEASGPAKAPGPPPEELVACLRGKGLTPPASLNDFKPWVLQQEQTSAGKTALNACGFGTDSADKAPGEGGTCAPGEASSSSARSAKRRAVPTT